MPPVNLQDAPSPAPAHDPAKAQAADQTAQADAVQSAHKVETNGDMESAQREAPPHATLDALRAAPMHAAADVEAPATRSRTPILAGALAGAICGVIAAFLIVAMKNRSAEEAALVESRIAALENTANAQPKIDPARVQALDGRVADIQKQVAQLRDGAIESGKAFASLRQSTDLAPLSARLQKLEQAAQLLETRVKGIASGQSANLGAGLLSATQSLRSAFERGSPIKGEFIAVQALSGSEDKLAPLKPYLDAGAPTTRALAERFRALRDQLLVSDNPPASSSVLDRLSASAGSLVKIRPVGEQGGNDTASIASRIDGALQRGDVDGALKEAKALPEKPAAAIAAWLKQADGRQAASAAIRLVEADALKLIAGTQ